MDSKVAPIGWVQWIIPVMATYVLLSVAALNGYPMVYSDTSTYLTSSFTLEVPVDRPVFYPVFMRLTSFGITPWLVIIAQSAITIFVLWQCLEFLLGHKISFEWKSRLLLGVVLGLAFATTLPWFVGQLMPDVFTGWLITCIFLLLYDSQLTT